MLVECLMRRAIRHTPLFLGAVLLTGCLIAPHTSERSPEFRGTVLDARTRSPVEGAKVALLEDPGISCTSDASGCFQLEATRNFHLLYCLLPIHEQTAEWPVGEKYYLNTVTITHSNYVTCRKDKPEGYILGGKGIILLEGSVLLEPKD